MAATFVAAANDPISGDSQATSRSVTKPLLGGAQVAVFFVNFWIGDGDGAGAISLSNAAVGATLRNDSVVGNARTATFIKYVDSDATGATYTFSFTPNDPWCALKAIFFADVDPGLDLATVPFNTASANGTGYATTTVTTVIDAALGWNGNAAEYSTAPTHTPPTSFTEVGDTDMSASAYRISPAGGSQSASGASTSGPVSNKISTLVALAPAAGGGVVVEGTATGSYGFTGTATGIRSTTGTASGSYGFTATAGGQRTALGAAAAAFGFTAVAAGVRRVLGAAAGAFGFTGTTTGVVSGVITGTATGSYGFAGTAGGVRRVLGQADGSYGFQGVAVGVIEGVVTGTATGSYGYVGTASGVRTMLGTATGSYGFTGTVVVDTSDPNPVILGAFGEPALMSYRETALPPHREPSLTPYREA